MSLKGFHIVFVTISTLLCLFMALWSFVLSPEPSTTATFLGIIGILGTAGMPIYGILFYRKACRIHL